jgi:N-acetylglucosaminyl-diphospho-decaprenol L-rhamnosyltransferase
MVSVLIVNFRSYEELTGCLESLRRHLADDIEVIVVDHQSDPEAADRLEREFAWVRLIALTDNPGFGSGVNRAAGHASGDLFLVLNPDCVVTNDVPRTLAAYMRENPAVAVTGAMVREPDGSLQASARQFPKFMTGLAGRTGFLTRWWPDNPWTAANLVQPAPANEPAPVDWVAGSCMMVRREAFDAVGGFDERFFMYWEDADLCFRLRQKGWTTFYVPSATVVHLTGRSTKRAPIRPLIAFHRSAYMYFRKNGDPRMQPIAPLVYLALQARLIFKLALVVLTKKASGS